MAGSNNSKLHLQSGGGGSHQPTAPPLPGSGFSGVTFASPAPTVASTTGPGGLGGSSLSFTFNASTGNGAAVGDGDAASFDLVIQQGFQAMSTFMASAQFLIVLRQDISRGPLTHLCLELHLRNNNNFNNRNINAMEMDLE
ncbi:unnamed protein product [Closterium sp. NIES-54]